jgi:ATP-binding cassette subfamily B protein/ATP-binding cassette subfamily C protein
MYPNDTPKQNLRNTIKSTRYMMRFVWKEKLGKQWIVSRFIMAIINAFMPLVYTIFPGLIIIELTDGERRVNTLMMYVGILLAAPVLHHASTNLINRYSWSSWLKLSLKFEAFFYNHNMSMDYEHLENPAMDVMKNRASNTLLNDGMYVAEMLIRLLESLMTVAALSSVIAMLNPLLLLLIVFFIFCNTFIRKWQSDRNFALYRERDIMSRHSRSLQPSMNIKEYAKEIRLFSIKDMLINMYIKYKSGENKLQMKSVTINNLGGIYSNLINFVQQALIYAYLLYNVLERALPVGQMTIYITATGQFSGAINTLMGAYMDLTRRSMDLQEMEAFFAIPFRQRDSGSDTPVFRKNSVIEFRNVSFQYPGSENFALKNLNLKIRGDEKLCVVGHNGSGKSTFIRLLTRLYFPTSGEILLDGVNINTFDYSQYQRLFAPVFQDMRMYEMTLAMNITLASDFDQAKLDDACVKAGLTDFVAKLPKGYETYVGKGRDLEGIIPSGGEAQRIAIARAIYHGGDVFLLDEPTAALDPLMEYEIYTQFSQMITDRAAVLITHRLSAVKLADKVAVFDQGTVVEYGTHYQLYAEKGVYTEMYDKQAEFYITTQTEKDGE